MYCVGKCAEDPRIHSTSQATFVNWTIVRIGQSVLPRIWWIRWYKNKALFLGVESLSEPIIFYPLDSISGWVRMCTVWDWTIPKDVILIFYGSQIYSTPGTGWISIALQNSRDEIIWIEIKRLSSSARWILVTICSWHQRCIADGDLFNLRLQKIPRNRNSELSVAIFDIPLAWFLLPLVLFLWSH